MMKDLFALFSFLLMAILQSGCSTSTSSQTANPAANSFQYIQQANGALADQNSQSGHSPQGTAHDPGTIGPWLTSKAPQLLSAPPLEYPPFAKSSHIEATVIVQFIVTTDGQVADAEVKQSSDHRFDEYALNGIKKWRFSPALVQGKPVKCRTDVPVVFSM
jgi:TonB family protein